MIDQCFVPSAIRRLDKTFSRLNTNSIRGCKEKLKDQRIVQTFRKLTSTDIPCQLIQLSKPSKPDTVPEIFMSDLTDKNPAARNHSGKKLFPLVSMKKLSPGIFSRALKEKAVSSRCHKDE